MNVQAILRRSLGVPAIAGLFVAGPLVAQDAVNVTIEAECPLLHVGDTTTVTVYGQIDSSIEAESDRIFSWYVDVLNDAGGVVAGYANRQTPTSDNDPLTSGDGTVVGSDLRGVYDTFLNTPAAGKGERIVLLQFEVTALSLGTANFSVAAGTTVGPLSDFLVAQNGGGGLTGGNYSAASTAITVLPLPDLDAVNLQVNLVGNMTELTFNPQPGFTHVVQWSDTIQDGSWTDLPGAPHNSGVLSQMLPPGQTRRFYRVCLTLCP